MARITRLGCFMLVGAVLANMGYSAISWQFWVILLSMAIVQITTAFENQDMDYMDRLEDLYRKHESFFDAMDFHMSAEYIEDADWDLTVQEPNPDEMVLMDLAAEELLADILGAEHE